MNDARYAPRFVGQSVKRKEDPRFLTGRGQFVDDHIVPGMLHAAFLRSPVARARIRSIDLSAARALPGVHRVFVAPDINSSLRPMTYSLGTSDPMVLTAPLADAQASYVGEPIALIVAEDRYVAEDAAELIDLTFDLLKPVTTAAQAKTAGPCLPGINSNLAVAIDTETPEVTAIFERAAVVVRKTIASARAAPTPMETRGVIAHRVTADQMVVWLASQNPHHAAAYLAGVLDMPESQVRVIAPDVGGGFGQKFFIHRDELAVIAAARLMGRPIKWIEDRSEALVAGGHSRTEELGLELAFDDDGHILATRFSFQDNVGADPLQPPSINPQLAMMFHTGPYKVAHTAAKVGSYFTNTNGNVAYRGPWAGETLIREAAMDEAARVLDLDPIELRRRNIITAADQPHRLPVGIELSGVTPLETLDQALEILDYPSFRAEQARLRAEGRYIGLGTSIYIEPSAVSGGSSASDVTEVRIDVSGKATAIMTVHSQGHSVETTMAQVIADELGLPLEDVSVSFGDTRAIGFGSGAGGSRQAVVGGGSAKLAAGQLGEKLRKLGAHLMQTSPDELRLEGGAVVAPGPTPRSVSFKELAEVAYRAPLTLPDGMEPGLEARFRYAGPPFTFSNATHLCVAEVDIRTGLVKVLRWIVSEDCGVMLNPAVVEGQVSGGVVQGIGGVLWEHQTYDAHGNPGAATLKDYLLPLATDIPLIEFGHICTPSPTPTGAKGVGEGGAIVAPPAMFNAVVDALAPFGVSFDALPLTPTRIMAALEAARGR